MATITLLVCCRGASVDKFSNSLSIFEILEGVSPDSFPIMIPKVMVVAMITKTPDDPDVLEATLRFKTGKEILVSATMDFTFAPGSTGSRAIMEMPGLPVVGPSDILIELSLPGTKSVVTCISVHSAKEMKPPKQVAASPKDVRKTSRKTVTAK